jgi:hypothetical protein
MPAHIGPDDVGDVMVAYLEDYMPKTWYDASRAYTKYISAAYLFSKHRLKRKKSAECTFNFKVRKSDNTRPTGLFDTASINRVDLFEKGRVSWSYQDTHFAADRREPAFNGGGTLEIFDYLDGQKQDMFDGFFDRNDEWLLSLATAPNDGSDGHPVPHGLPYWLTPSTTADFGFNGVNPSGYDETGGIDRDDYDKLRNGTFTVTSMSGGDGLKKIRKAMRKCQFKTPKKVSPEAEITNEFMLLTHEDWFFDYEDTLDARNENVGKDAGKYSSGIQPLDMNFYKSVPWIYADQFSDEDSPAYDANKPIYGINWSTFFVYTYGDWFMKQDDPIQLTDQPNTFVVWMNTAYQTVCVSPRNNFRGRVAA